MTTKNKRDAADVYLSQTYTRPNSQQAAADLHTQRTRQAQIAQGDGDYGSDEAADSDTITFRLIPETGDQGGTPASSTATPLAKTAAEREGALLAAIDAAETEADLMAAMRAYIDGREADRDAQDQRRADEQKRAADRAEADRQRDAETSRKVDAKLAAEDRAREAAAQEKATADKAMDLYFGATYRQGQT